MTPGPAEVESCDTFPTGYQQLVGIKIVYAWSIEWIKRSFFIKQSVMTGYVV